MDQQEALDDPAMSLAQRGPGLKRLVAMTTFRRAQLDRLQFAEGVNEGGVEFVDQSGIPFGSVGPQE